MPLCKEKQLLHSVLLIKRTCDSLHFLNANKSERIPPAKCCVMNNHPMSTGQKTWHWMAARKEHQKSTTSCLHLFKCAVSHENASLFGSKMGCEGRFMLTWNSNSKIVICTCNIKCFIISKTPSSNSKASKIQLLRVLWSNILQKKTSFSQVHKVSVDYEAAFCEERPMCVCSRTKWKVLWEMAEGLSAMGIVFAIKQFCYFVQKHVVFCHAALVAYACTDTH